MHFHKILIFTFFSTFITIIPSKKLISSGCWLTLPILEIYYLSAVDTGEKFIAGINDPAVTENLWQGLIAGVVNTGTLMQ
jgi:hypothetical protein